MNWRGTFPHRLESVVRAWEGEAHVLLFDPASGDTHLLSSLAGLLLEILAQRTLDFKAVLAEVQVLAEAQSDLPELLREHLQRLTRLGILQECPAC